MKESIKISIIIPVYNVEKYIDECLKSVLEQTYKNLEIILVDDGSKDNSAKICDDYAKRDNRVKVFHKENGGLSSARNVGMRAVTGDFFIFLDSDDYWIKLDFVEEMIKLVMNNNTDLIIFGYTRNEESVSDHVRDKETEKTISNLDKTECFEWLIKNDKLQSSAWNKMVNTRFLKNYNINFQEGIYSEDIDWTARLLIYVNKIFYFDDYIYFYRSNDQSITHNIKEKNIIDLKNQILKILSFADEIKSEGYYEWYMNYCSYQYITFLNCIVTVETISDRKKYINEMKKYRYLLKYNTNKKVKIVSFFNKFLGYKGMLTALKIFLKLRHK